MTPVSSTTTMIGWIGENAMLIILCSKTNTDSIENFSRFQIFTVPLSLPVANKQYLTEAAAHVSYSWDSLISLMI
jgi:hypothetical protein